MHALAPALLLLAVIASSCGGPCRDRDGDGFGAGCERGPDCDDDDPARARSCDDAGGADCERSPSATGCPCLSGEHMACYDAPAETASFGTCRAGRAQCIVGRWTRCEGAILPAPELCNTLDDDCDGTADEGVLSPCGGCNTECIGGVWGPPLAPFVASDTLDLTAAGELTLRRHERQADHVWVPNTAEGTLSKVDARRALELARYRTPSAAPVRIAVDQRGDAWVLDAPEAGPSFLTKYAALREHCLDRDADGVRTSESSSDLLAFEQDECMLVSVKVADAGQGAQALAVDGTLAPDRELAGHVWVGLAHAHELLQFDGETGRELARHRLPGFAPYAGAFDSWGVLWLVDRAGLLARVDPQKAPAQIEILTVPLACYTLENLAIDAEGRLVLTGFSCESVITFDPAQRSFHARSTENLLTPRGVAAVGGEGWVVYTSGQIGHFSGWPLDSLGTHSLASATHRPYESIAIGSDERGGLWIASALGGTDGRGVLTRFDPVLQSVSAQVDVGLGPRALGDMTGSALGGRFVPRGEVTQVFSGCGHEDLTTDAGSADRTTIWQRLHLSALAGAGASVTVSARWAARHEELGARSYVVLGTLPADASPFPLDLPDGGVVEIRLELEASFATGAPRIARVGIEWRCAGPD